MTGLILYGPPASGKDTVTAALSRLDPTYQRHRVLKAGRGTTRGYVSATPEAIRHRNTAHKWTRYGSLYAIDRDRLQADLAEGVPVLHCGDPAQVEAITQQVGGRWVLVSLWCPREIAAQRLRDRGAVNVADRLRQWDETEPVEVDLHIDSSTMRPDEIARTIYDYACS